MDAQLKAKWVEALRSGEYKQAIGKLHDPKTDSYCCLGVLCKLVGAEWREFSEVVEDDDGPRHQSYEHVPVKNGTCLSSADDEELKAAVAIEFGINSVMSELIDMNDGRLLEKPDHERHKPSKPFSEIADYIEANL